MVGMEVCPSGSCCEWGLGTTHTHTHTPLKDGLDSVMCFYSEHTERKKGDSIGRELPSTALGKWASPGA